MKMKKWIIVFSGYWSPSYVYGIGNVIKEFHKDNYSVLWINSIPNRNPSQKRAGSRRALLKNLFRKLLLHFVPIKKVEARFFVFTPIYFPMPENRWVYKFNQFFLQTQLLIVKLFLGIRNGFILFSSSMVNIPYLFPSKKYSKYVHYIADLYSDYREASQIVKYRIREQEKELFNEADLLLVSSYFVVEKVQKIVEDSSKIVYFPHGVEFEHFNSSLKMNYNVLHLKDLNKPIAGYFGSLTMANDQEAMLSIRDAGFIVVLIGAIKGDYSRLMTEPDIYFLGEISYDELPKHASCFDVAFMAWKQSEWIRNSNPKKTFEYLAMGLPIISVRIHQLEKELSEFVYFADHSADYGKLALKALNEDSPVKRLARIGRSQKEDWGNKYQIIKEHIGE
jgi:hypothetical protein